MKKQWSIEEGCLKIPVQENGKTEKIRICLDEKPVYDGEIALSRERIDFWAEIPFHPKEGALLTVEGDPAENWFEAIHWEEKESKGDFAIHRPYFHFTPPSGSLGAIRNLYCEEEKWKAEAEYNPFGSENGNFLYLPSVCEKKETEQGKDAREYYSGDVEESYLFEQEKEQIIAAKSKVLPGNGLPYRNMLSIPMRLKQEENGLFHLEPREDLSRLRIWKREWEEQKEQKEFEASLSFRIVPEQWPNIRLKAPEGCGADIKADAYEIQLDLAGSGDSLIELELCGWHCIWNCRENILTGGSGSINTEEGRLRMTVYLDIGCAEFICRDQILFLLEETPQMEHCSVDNSVSGNIGKCTIACEKEPKIEMKARQGALRLNQLLVYGMRDSGVGAQGGILGYKKESPVFYKSENFTVYYDRVRDRAYGYPDAAAVSDRIVISPLRVTEEFNWRKTPWGDMVRTINREDTWYATAALEEYPGIHTPVTVFNAAYHIALDTFVLCKDRKYALSGQAGLWSAGLFQGPGAGFGVWLRDSAHTAIRSGNLIDPKAAGQTLRYAMDHGFDNGTDGLAMGIIGIWDYYLATGEETILYEVWPMLLQNIREADKLYEPSLNLLRAEQSTSNDAFPEPENGGYCLSTECCYKKAYEAMGAMGRILSHHESETREWEEKSIKIKEAIIENYWNPQYGYFTSGPRGSEAYEQGHWETSGQECAIWSKFSIATMEQKTSVLKALPEAAMSEYGIRLFPYRKEKNHFCGTVWGVWQAGFGAAASQLGDLSLLHQLIAQQIRVCLMNKTFYEVIDGDTGLAWRWPGQLWHAAGYLSLIYYGVMGMEYDIEGLRFHPAVPRELKHMKIERLPYRKSVLDIEIKGWGTRLKQMLLDGSPCEQIPASSMGNHSIVLLMENHAQNGK